VILQMIKPHQDIGHVDYQDTQNNLV